MLQTRSFEVCVLLIQEVMLWLSYWSQCLHVIRIHWSEFTKPSKMQNFIDVWACVTGLKHSYAYEWKSKCTKWSV